MGLDPGTVVAKRYKVHRQLGKGGMGEVFSAENTRTGRMVAIKVLRAESRTKQSAIERFRREARAAGSINSDFVTQVLDVEDDPDHGIVLVFELLEGESLVERLKRTGPVPYQELWGIVEAVWMGLADAHEAGIIHRDLKPSNVFLEQRRAGRRVKILDFGISKLPKGISTESLTQVGQSLGTFSFMPPEQIGKAKNVDHRADIYACTTLVYQALSGKLPYKAKNVVAMMELKNKSEPRTLGEVMSEPVDDQLEAFIARGLSRNPDERFQSAREALDVWRRLRPPGALSVTDLDASGSYSSLIDEPPSSSEAMTIVVRKPRLPQPSDQAPTPQLQEELGYGAAAMLERPQQQQQQHVVPEPTPPMAPEPAAQPAPQQHAHGAPMPFDLRASSSPSGQPGVTAEAPMFEDALPAQRSGARMLLALVLGAIGLMLVGFFTVALVLHLLG